MKKKILNMAGVLLFMVFLGLEKLTYQKKLKEKLKI